MNVKMKGAGLAVAHNLTSEQLKAHHAALLAVTYPEELPVSARRTDIMRAIKYSQVVIVAGETGSGKTTQLPKMLLEMGYGREGLIGHTQPRRLAARSVAERISAELGTAIGETIGYHVRFTDHIGPSTLVKLMTDGILLAEIQSDPDLRKYSAIIIDEAHERSLNIDFLLGYLARLLPRRPDLRLIITSATIDSERFAAHFGERMYGGFPGNLAPVIEVSGRTYPVEIRYRPLFTGDISSTSSSSRTLNTASSAANSFDGDGRADANRHQTSSTLPNEKHDDIDGIDDDYAENRPTSQDQTSAIIDAAHELCSEGSGDILVFLSGEGEILETHKAFKDELRSKYIEPGGRSSVPGAIEVLPLFARLSAAEQHRIFEPHQHRRIILATNIAETSLTVPGIRYVIDPGTARISRYSNKTKVQRLPIEAISQASANQRSGRCGRVADGIAIRLYSEEDFAARPEYTEPEIQRTSLASVILQMASLGLGKVEDFPFIDPPDVRAVRSGVQLLEEIGALRGKDLQLTKIGRQLARLPIDPRLGRMLLAADRNGAAAEVLVLVAAMSVQDVRERPAEFKAQADQLHARFTEPTSDFLAYLNIWRYLRTQQRELSGSAFRRLCRAEHINWLRWREWQDVVTQLRELAKPLGLNLRPIPIPTAQQLREAETQLKEKRVDTSQHRSVIAAVKSVGKSSDAPASAAIHRSLLVGLLSNLGSWDERKRDYEGARGTHFVIWPGSGLNRRHYSWVMAAELVETSRLFARSAAKIDPAWIEPIAKHLVKRTYSEPFWSIKNGAAMVHERVTLYGLTVTADRPVLAASIGTSEAREMARDIFIRSALVEGQWRAKHHAFVKHNTAELEKAREVETRLRQYGVVADDSAQFAFFDERLPQTITSAANFERWWKHERHKRPHLLDFTQDFLLGENQLSAASADFPEEWIQGDIRLPITYSFNPGGHADGLSIEIPVTLLPQIRDEGFDWLVPGLLPELVTATIRALPKRVRRNLVPAPDVARDINAYFLKRLENYSAENSALSGSTASDSPASGSPASSSPACSVFPTSAASHGVSHAVSNNSAPDESFRSAFTAAVMHLRGIDIDLAAWEEAQAALPSHLRITFIVRSERGAVLDEGTSLSALQHNLAPQSKSAVQNVMAHAVSQALDEARDRIIDNQNAAKRAAALSAATEKEKERTAQAARACAAQLADSVDDLHAWPALAGGELAHIVETEGAGGAIIRGYPALVYEKNGVALRVLTNEAEQQRDHRIGVIHLLAGELELPEARITTRWNARESLALAASPYSDTSSLVSDMQLTATRNIADRWARENKQPLGKLRTESAYRELKSYARERTEDETLRIAQIAARALEAWGEVESALRTHKHISLIATTSDVREAVDQLIYRGFISSTPEEYLPDLPRFLRAAAHRIEKAVSNPSGDDALAWQVRDAEELRAHAHAQAAAMQYDPERAATLEKARWLIEELRVSLFAQQIGTRVKVSPQRIRKLLG
ncbi:ATP-dependent RNA helicase HrpA [Chlamydia trachomatis]|nr:ATP-dependent RNA helicase HrpA [Chlamydia trachomatis]